MKTKGEADPTRRLLGSEGCHCGLKGGPAFSLQQSLPSLAQQPGPALLCSCLLFLLTLPQILTGALLEIH